MVFQKYNYAGGKAQITKALRERQDIKRRIRYHQCKIEHHENKIKEIETKTLVEIEEKIEKMLERTQK